MMLVGCGEEPVPTISEAEFLRRMGELQAEVYPSRVPGTVDDIDGHQSVVFQQANETESLAEDAQILSDGDWILDSESRGSFLRFADSPEMRALHESVLPSRLDQMRLSWDSRDSHVMALGLRSAAQTVLLHGKALAVEGETRRFVDTVQSSAALSELLESNSVAISTLIVYHMRSLEYEMANELAAWGYLDNSAMEEIGSALSPMSLAVLRAVGEGERLFYHLEPVVDDDYEWEDPLDRSHREIFDDLEEQYGWFQTQLTTVDLESPACLYEAGGVRRQPNMFGGVYITIVSSYLIQRQQHAGMMAVFQVARFRNEHGRLPLPSEFESPVDPANGGGFVYRLDDDTRGGFVLYSRGLDGIDDGGNFDEESTALRKNGQGMDYPVYPNDL